MHTSRRRSMLLVALVLGAATYASLRAASVPGDPTERPATPAMRPPMEEGWRGLERLSVASRRADGTVDARDLGDASVPRGAAPAELGTLRADYAQWASEPRDETTSRRATAHAEDMLAHFDVTADSVDVACTTGLCRAEIVFGSEADLHALSRVPTDRASLRVGTPFVSGSSATVIAYWDRVDPRVAPF